MKNNYLKKIEEVYDESFNENFIRNELKKIRGMKTKYGKYYFVNKVKKKIK